MRSDLLPTVGALTAALVLAASAAGAQPFDVEAEHRRGVALRSERRDVEAAEVFRSLYERTGEARALARLGLAEAAAGRWLDAEAHLQRAMARVDDPWVVQNRASLEQGLRAVQPHLGSLVIRCATPGAEFLVDGRRVTLREDRVRVVAGALRVEVRAEGHEPFTHDLTVEPGSEPQPLEVALTPIAPPPPPPQAAVTPAPPRAVAVTSPTASSTGPWRALAIGAWSLGGVGLVLGGAGQATGWSYAGRFEDGGCELYSTAPASASSPTCLSHYRTATGWLTASVVSLVAGGALVAAGTALWFLAPRAHGGHAGLGCAPWSGPVGLSCVAAF